MGVRLKFKSCLSPMCCPGVGLGPGEEEEGRQGERPGPPSGQRRCDCSRPSNCCHTLSMGNTGSERGTERG